MTLLPVLPVLSDESLTSYVNRAAYAHGNIDIFRFLSFLELPQGAIMSPKSDQLDRIAQLFGLPCEQLGRMAFLPEGGRMRSICGERVHAEFAYLNKTSYCPACLLADADPCGPSHGRRVGRIAWQIEAVRTCPHHGIALFRRKNTDHSENLQIMSRVAPGDAELREQVHASMRRMPSNLQTYIERRLAGDRQSPWLDSQPIDLASRACEMLGVVITAGTHCDLRKVCDDQWNEAGDIGYSYAHRGEVGILEALEIVRQDAIRRRTKGGPQKVLGRLYQWLQFNKNNKPHGPIQGVVREYILNHFPIEAGSQLFGEIVVEQRVHTVHSLARKTGDHPKTINRAVIAAGLCEGDPDRAQALAVFDLETGERLMTRVRNSIPVSALPGYLNCNRVQAQQLVHGGFIPRLVPENPNATGVLKQVAVEDADRFLAQFLGMAKNVKVASEGLMDLVSAAELSRWPVIDIIAAVLSGSLGRVEIVDPALKFKGVLVDPTEVREVLSRQGREGLVGPDEAGRISGLSRPALNSLTRIRRPSGRPWLTAHQMVNSKGAPVRLYSAQELKEFLDRHVSLRDYAAQHGISAKAMKQRLESCGIEPIADNHCLGRFYYERSVLNL